MQRYACFFTASEPFTSQELRSDMSVCRRSEWICGCLEVRWCNRMQLALFFKVKVMGGLISIHLSLQMQIFFYTNFLGCDFSRGVIVRCLQYLELTRNMRQNETNLRSFLVFRMRILKRRPYAIWTTLFFKTHEFRPAWYVFLWATYGILTSTHHGVAENFHIDICCLRMSYENVWLCIWSVCLCGYCSFVLCANS